MYWVIDPLRDAITLTEFHLTASGEYELARRTQDVFTTDQPWPVTLDLPALTAWRARLMGQRANRS